MKPFRTHIPSRHILFTNGIAHIRLANGESCTITNIPEGVSYVVNEDDVPGNFITNSSGSTGTIVKEGNEVVFTNTERDTSESVEHTEMMLKKETVDADELDEDTEYEFMIQFAGLESNTNYRIETDKPIDSNTLKTTFKSDSAGDAYVPVSLLESETITFKSLAISETYRITESAGDWAAFYNIRNLNTNGSIVKDSDENLVKNTDLSTSIVG